ncbi:MAG: alpha/beta fold hydrolase [Rhodobacter sp.]|uniref:alpha/beta fold hydrolase n=1 Tax=Pararhodobacter sp. TaxID=2127056 RepID=UPI001DDC049C|nr:alpha/beta fold hydrolase [Pararhodobacter sp.]MCB1346796.1 alpha/beta fold hydrolase [Paracoccaceae bacterium]MCC0072064.1 alpha/beta fold hydrolase [Rhodobacter sp.]HPD93382.1 alpha/beta fold hydrolase [Pararhodobacter sp.]
MPLLTLLRHGTPTDLPPLLIVHGLFGSARNWGAIAKRMSDSREVIAVDMRNHANSFWDGDHSYAAMAADLAAVIAAEGHPMDVLGHSMGGKAAMVLALTRPAQVQRLVVADIAPVAYPHSQNHLIAAMRGLDLSGVDSRSEADRRLSASVQDPGVRAFLLQSLDLKATPPRWRLNLDTLERHMDQTTGWIDDSALTPFDKPALFLTGALSDYVKPTDRAHIRALFPQAKMAKIPGAGHWLHAEKPREFEAALRVFLGPPAA